MRGSDAVTLAALALALAGGGCGTRTIVAVDPPPCAGTDAAAASLASCASGLLDELIGYWRLDDAPGSTAARDGSGRGNDGTLVDLDPSIAWVAGGPESRALSVQAKGYVQVAPSASIDSITDQVTVAAWMYLDGTISDFSTAISRQIETGNGQHYHLSVNAQSEAALFITTTTHGQTLVVSPTTVPQQEWIHLAGTYDGSAAVLYVNGAEVARLATSGPFAAETNPVILAGNGNASAVTELVPGQLDEVLLYRRALAPGEIARIASGALLPSGSFAADGGARD